jgi:hypothetical protein
MEPGFRPITDTLEHDIFIVGYPRSGHTWFQNLVAGIVFGIDPEFAHDSLIQERVPDVHYKRTYKRYGATAYFKSHELPRKEYRRVVYLLRDGRDVMVSYWHFLKALRGDVDFLMLVQGEGLTPCRWHEHVDQWLANPHGAEQLVVRYEDLQAQPLRELGRFCSFAKLERTPAQMEHVAEKAAFAKAKHKERTQGWDNAAWPKEHAFIRRGEVGSWRDEMPADVLAAFLSTSGGTLKRLGYLT